MFCDPGAYVQQGLEAESRLRWSSGGAGRVAGRYVQPRGGREPRDPLGASSANPGRAQAGMRHRGNHPFLPKQREGRGLRNLPTAPRAAAASPGRTGAGPAHPQATAVQTVSPERGPGAPGPTRCRNPGGGGGGARGRDQDGGEGRGPGQNESESGGEGCGGADVTRMEGEGRNQSMNGGRGRHEGGQGRGKSTRR